MSKIVNVQADAVSPFLLLLMVVMWLLIVRHSEVGETAFYFRVSEDVKYLLLTSVKSLFTLFEWISPQVIFFFFFFFQFHNRNLGLISTSVNLIKLLHGIQIKEELLLTGKAVVFVKYVACSIYFLMCQVLWWYDVALLIHFFQK